MKWLLRTAACFVLIQALQAASPWSALVDDFYETYFQAHPTLGTWEGLHAYDTCFEPYSRKAIALSVKRTKAILARLVSFPVEDLSPRERIDREILMDKSRADLLAMERVRTWERDPGLAPNTACFGISLLMARPFAAPKARLASLVKREILICQGLRETRAAIQNPPRIYTEIALEQIPEIISFFSKDVPSAFKEVKDPALDHRFRAVNERVVQELRIHQTWLRSLLPHSKGEFALGAELFRLKLQFEEKVDLPLEDLLALGMADLKRNQKALAETAARIDPAASVQAIVARAVSEHPTRETLIPSFQAQLKGAESFVSSHDLMSIPPHVLPAIQETPPYGRATTIASMNAPGPYDVVPGAIFYVTLPEIEWSRERTENWLRIFNRGMIFSTTIHEAFPGHYLQSLISSQNPSKVRKLALCETYSEGWAHYVEEMVLEEGFGDGDPWLKLGQLQDALLRNVRLIVAIRLHTGGMTLSEAKGFFVHEGFQVESSAEAEAKRGTQDPSYLAYTLGKLEILKLREDMRKRQGSAFSLKAFHDALLAQGSVPIPFVRRELLGADGGPSL